MHVPRAAADVATAPPASRRQRVLDAILGAFVALVCFAVVAQLGPPITLVGPLLGLAIALRRVSFSAMSALGFAVALIQVVSGDVHYLADLAYALLFFTLGRSSVVGWRRFGLGCAVFASAVAGLFMLIALGHSLGEVTWRDVVSGVVFAGITALVVLGGWTLGYARLQRERAQVAATEALIGEAERRRLAEAFQYEQERAQIATEMHDIVAHSWAVVAAQADGARYAVRRDPAAAEGALKVIGETARSAMVDLSQILSRLRYQESGEAIPGYAQAEQIVERMQASGMDCRITTRGEPATSPLIALNATRIMGEALTNALKHGDLARPVCVEWDWTTGLRLRVTSALRPDEGDTALAVALSTGHGLVGMAERARTLGGTIDVGPSGDHWIVDMQISTIQEAS